jgi:hypothetical protein
MPLLRVSAHPIPTAGSYKFCKQHKELWNEFWEEMDGDMDKILDFAEKAGVDDPKEWFEELHRFLFDFFCGDPKILKNAAKKTFGSFISEVVKNHVNNPKCDWWYHTKGLSKQQFIKALEMAADFEDPKQAINHLNARMADFGAKLYSEFLLSLANKKAEIKSIASQKNQEAFKIEHEVFGKNLLDNFQVGSIVGHSLFANSELEILEVEEPETKTAQKISDNDVVKLYKEVHDYIIRTSPDAESYMAHREELASYDSYAVEWKNSKITKVTDYGRQHYSDIKWRLEEAESFYDSGKRTNKKWVDDRKATKTASTTSTPTLIAKNKAGNLCKILDIWNLE